jgi:hypothetical protein
MRHSSCRTTLDVYTRAVDQQKREASLKVVKMMLPLDVEKFQHPSASSDTQKATRRCRQITVKEGLIGGPDRDRTDDLFHAIVCNLNGYRDIDGIVGVRKARRVIQRSCYCVLVCVRVFAPSKTSVQP